MAQVELIMPKMGESVAEATIIKWLKDEGDSIDLEESVLEIATDKVDSDVPSPTEGILKKKLYNEDDVVKVGEPIALIETEGEATGDESQAEPVNDARVAQPATSTKEQEERAVAEAESMVTSATETAHGEIPRTSNGRFYSPLVRSIAKEENISVDELDNLEGSGAEGRVTKKDVLGYLENRGEAPAKKQAPAEKAAPQQQKATPTGPEYGSNYQAPPVSVGGDDEIIEMDRMRKKISEHMAMSKKVSPHVTSFVEADVTNLVNWRNKIKTDFQKREGEKITFTPLFIEAVVKAIKDFPMINVSVDGNNIVKKKHINIGMAAALPSGNLIVPVIHDADQYNLLGLTKKVNDLANRARQNKLKPDEISGGTFTMTNVGTFGNVMGTPIINQPQVAILATGSINKKPAVIETPDGDLIGIRQKMFLSHSYDHRVVDGALGGSFVKRVAEYLEQFDVNRDY